jgi:hypothetical protein
VAHLRDRPGLPAWHCHGASVTSAGGPGREYHVRSASTFTAGAGGPVPERPAGGGQHDRERRAAGGEPAALTTSPATDAIMGAVLPEKAGAGSAVNDTTRELGGTLGVAVAGSVMASFCRPHVLRSPTVAVRSAA